MEKARAAGILGKEGRRWESPREERGGEGMKRRVPRARGTWGKKEREEKERGAREGGWERKEGERRRRGCVGGDLKKKRGIIRAVHDRGSNETGGTEGR